MENVLLGILGILLGGGTLVFWYLIRDPDERGEERLRTNGIILMGILFLVVGFVALVDGLTSP